jgi:hypothetical protein
MRQDPLPNWGGDAADAWGMFCRSITTPAAEDSTSWAVLWSTHFPASFFTSGHFQGLNGTTEVVPFPKRARIEVFPLPAKGRHFEMRKWALDGL